MPAVRYRIDSNKRASMDSPFNRHQFNADGIRGCTLKQRLSSYAELSSGEARDLLRINARASAKSLHLLAQVDVSHSYLI